MDALSNDPRYAGSLRSALTAKLYEQGAIRTEAVVRAFRTVPRHLFVPNVPLDVAYADDVVLMKSDEAGVAISTVSQPTVVAMMLEQAAIRPGDRVLEIGSGGYNAALLSELVGADGRVTTVDIDPDVVERARRTLADAGYPGVRVVEADGEFGCPEGAPYDVILLTVTAADIAPAWREQLVDGGRLVVPLRLRGQTRSVAFDKTGDALRSRSTVICGFVSMQGAGANSERVVPLHGDEVYLSLDEDQEIDVASVADVLDQPGEVAWSGILLNREEPFSNLDLRLATVFPEYCLVSAHRSAVERGLVAPAPRWGAAAVVRDDSLAYLTSRPSPVDDLVELGVRAQGPAAKTLADEVIDHIIEWDQRYREHPGPMFTVHPRSTPPEALPPGTHLRTRHNHITLHWA